MTELTPADQQFYKNIVIATIHLYRTTHYVPKPRDIAKLLNYELAPITMYFETDEFKLATSKAGLPTLESPTALTSRQIQVLAVVTNPLDRRSLNGKLREAGVTANEFQTWKANPVFQSELDSLTVDLLQRHEREIETALVSKAMEADPQALEYLRKRSKDQTEAAGLSDTKFLVASLLTIIQEEIKDPDTLARIASRLQLLTLPAKVQAAAEPFREIR